MILFLMVSCNKDVITGSGSITETVRTPGSFSGLNTEGNVKVHITYAPEISVKLMGYANLIPEFVTEVKNNILYLHYRDRLNVKHDNIEVFLTMPGFTAINTSGSSVIAAEGNFDQAAQLSILSSGNSEISIDNMTVENYIVSGSGNCNIATVAVNAKTAKIEISGNGTVSLSASEKLDVSISGSGTVSYKGDPAVTTDISGNGKLIKL